MQFAVRAEPRKSSRFQSTIPVKSALWHLLLRQQSLLSTNRYQTLGNGGVYTVVSQQSIAADSESTGGFVCCPRITSVRPSITVVQTAVQCGELSFRTA